MKVIDKDSRFANSIPIITKVHIVDATEDIADTT